MEIRVRYHFTAWRLLLCLLNVLIINLTIRYYHPETEIILQRVVCSIKCQVTRKAKLW